MSTDKTGDQQLPLLENTGPTDTNEAEADTNGNSATQLLPDQTLLGTQPGRAIIWTPRFICIFALVLILGLSIQSLLTQGWLNSLYTGQWVFQVQVLLNFLAWLALAFFARSRWTRLGGIFGCIWAFFMTIDVLISSYIHNPPFIVFSNVNTPICLSLLGCYICLSIDHMPLTRWDAWLLGLLPIIGILLVWLQLLTTWEFDRSLLSIESNIAVTALLLCLFVWWLRPTCWKLQPGPTFLFGAVPLILLVSDIANGGFNAINFFLARDFIPASHFPITEHTFFFSQVVLLCLFLGTIRLLQGEFVRK